MNARTKSRANGSTSKRRSLPAPARILNHDGPNRGFPVVGVGASAGGFEAFTKFLEQLPADTGMAFVLVQHLDPRHESRLSELLGRATKLPVIEVKRLTQVEPNHVYVIPPNKNLIISHGRLQLSSRQKSEIPPMPIDHFLRSLAEDQGHNAIGMIFSGNGSDGTLGLEAIKGADGITLAQTPGTAQYPSMPERAIASGCVDFIQPPGEMAAELAKLPRSLLLEESLGEHPETSDHAMIRIYSLLRTATGVDFSLYKQTTLKRRIARRMVVHRINDLASYATYLRGHPPEVEKLSEDVLINVTRFFRDTKSLQVLVKKVFPALLHRRPVGRPIRIWVPGCSSGEEVYSLAMLLAEQLGKRAVDYPVQLFGTDISEGAVAKARAGSYRNNIMMDVSAARLRRFFTQVGENYVISKAIREQCVFARQNLVGDPPFSQLDLISCQNVMIYFGPELQQRVLRTFHYALKPHGLLLLGSAEGVGGLGELFTPLDHKQRIYVKSSALPPGELGFEFQARKLPADAVLPEATILPEVVLPSVDRMADRVLLQHYAPDGVVVDGRMRVLQFRGQTAPYLEHKPGTANLNLFKMLHQELVVPVRVAVAKAVKQQSAAGREIVWIKGNTDRRLLHVQVIPFRLPPDKEQLLFVLFKAGARVEPPTAKLARAIRDGHDGDGDGELRRLHEELEGTRASLQAIIEEHEATNEELRSANEESQSSNEELQSTNEELETAKEEMQSTNEELNTVNDELQGSNLEAARVNNDLLNLLASVQIPVVMVDAELRVRRFTPSAQRFFSLIPSDVGRHLSDIKVNLRHSALDALIREVIDTLVMQEIQVQDAVGRWFSLRIRPYRTKDNKIDGAVLALVDIHDLKHGLEQFTDVLWDPCLTLTNDLHVVKANAAFYKKFDVPRAETEGRFVYELGNGQWDIPALRKLLEQVLPRKTLITDYAVEHKFPSIGRRKMLLNARQLETSAMEEKLILLAIRDVTDNGKK